MSEQAAHRQTLIAMARRSRLRPDALLNALELAGRLLDEHGGAMARTRLRELWKPAWGPHWTQIDEHLAICGLPYRVLEQCTITGGVDLVVAEDERPEEIRVQPSARTQHLRESIRSWREFQASAQLGAV